VRADRPRRWLTSGQIGSSTQAGPPTV
jgi:hypothetical protein